MNMVDSKRISRQLALSDVEIHTMLDQAFCGEYLLTPTLHSHPFYEIICTVDGTFEIGFTDGTSISMHKNSVCVLPPNLYHRTYASKLPVRKLAIQFHYRRVKSMQMPVYSSFHQAFSRIREPRCCISPEICYLMEQLRDEMRGHAAGSEVMQGVLVSELYIRLMRLLQTPDEVMQDELKSHDSQNQRYLQIEDFLAQHQTDHVTAVDLAEELGLSRRQMDRIFMEIYGMSFRARLIELRLSLAVHLLGTTDIPVETVAEQVGYETHSGFYMAFRKHYGVSAAEYRRWFRSTFTNET